MADKTTALIFLVKDNASGAVKNLENAVHSLSQKADIGGRAMHSFGSILSGIGVGIGFAAFTNLENIFSRLTQAIPELVTKGISFAESVHQIQLVTGGTAEEVSHLLGIFQYLGISSEGLAQKFGLIAKNAVAHADALRRVGVDIGSVNTGFDNQIVILDKLRDALSGVEGGTARQTVLQSVLGRNAATLTEYFSLTTDQVNLLNAEMDKLGITMTEQGVLKAEAVSKEFNLFGLSIQGVANRLLTDVAPALQSAVDGLATFVAENGKAIAQFASDVVNFVFGMIDALTGATFAAAPFTSQMEQLAGATNISGDALDSYTSKSNAAGSSTAGTTKAINDKIAALKAEDAAADKLYARELDGLTKVLDAETATLDASLRARHDKESQIDLAQQLIDAEQRLGEARAGTNGIVDPAAVTEAYKAVSDVVQRQGDAQAQAQVDARKAEIGSVKDYIAQIEQALKDSTDKKALLAQLDKDATDLLSQEAAAKQSGDLQRVADLDLELQAVRTTRARAEELTRTTLAEAALNRQKEALSKIGGAAGAAGAQVGILGSTIVRWMDDGKQQIVGVSDAVAVGPTSLIGAFTAATASGVAFGESIKTALANVTGAIGGAVDLLGQFSALIGGIPIGELGIAVTALATVTGNVPLAIAGLAMMGIAVNDIIANQTPGTLPNGQPDNPAFDTRRRQLTVPGHVGSPVAPPIPQGGSGPGYINNTIYLDGQVIAQSTNRILNNESRLNGVPHTGPGGF